MRVSGLPSANFADELIETIYAAMLGETSWQTFLDQLNRISPDTFSTLFFHDLNRSSGGVTLVAGGYDSAQTDYEAYYSSINPWMKRVAATPLGVGVIGEQIVDRKEFNKTEYYHDFIHRNGLETGIGVTLFRDEGCYFLLSILTGDTEIERNLERAELLSKLAPHLQRVFRYYRTGPFNQSVLSYGKTIGDAANAALIIVDDKLRVRTTSTAGEALLAKGDIIGLDALGRIRMTNAGQHARLCRMLDRGSGEDRTAQFQNGKRSVQFVRIGLNRDVEFFAGLSVAILIAPMTHTAQAVEDALCATYSLTPAERRVLSGILSGQKLKQIAETNGIGLETVRSQLKGIYFKTGVNSQTDLIRIASGFAD
ncbi:MAG: hypothetical protein KF874_10435 [Rhizobiaceae bacterium]|nr:hypothetical protein [Rhizobiaceae bacterium]